MAVQGVRSPESWCVGASCHVWRVRSWKSASWEPQTPDPQSSCPQCFQRWPTLHASSGDLTCGRCSCAVSVTALGQGMSRRPGNGWEAAHLRSEIGPTSLVPHLPALQLADPSCGRGLCALEFWAAGACDAWVPNYPRGICACFSGPKGR